VQETAKLQFTVRTEMVSSEVLGTALVDTVPSGRVENIPLLHRPSVHERLPELLKHLIIMAGVERRGATGLSILQP
jgi:hypothetical protein